MPENPDRRAVLADAGLTVLADHGARGLTHRAVDDEADVPTGTAANYFRSRDELLTALGDRLLERLAPDPVRVEELSHRELDLDLFAQYMTDIVARVTAEPGLMIALVELRLEARRRPGLFPVLSRTLERGYQADVEFSRQAGFAAGPLEIALMRFAMDGLLLDLLTPSIGAEAGTNEIVAALVQRLLGAAAER